MAGAIDAHVGKQLTARRMELGLTCEDLAAALRLDPTDLARFESGDQRMSPVLLVRACDLLDLNLSQLFLDFNPPITRRRLDKAAEVIDLAAHRRRPKRSGS